MDIKQLRYFSAVYERRSVSHAAEHCCVAQSAISHHLAAIEAEVGVKLFQRTPRGMEPTPSGTRLYEHAQFMLRSLQAAVYDVRMMSGDITGRMELGLPHSVMEAIIVPLLEKLRRELPKAEIVIVEALSDDLYRGLVSGEHDLIFCYNPLADSNVKIARIHNEPLCCAGHRDFLGDRPDPIDFETAMQLPKIILRSGASSRAVSRQAKILQALLSSAEFQLNSVVGMRKALAAGVATAVCPYITVRELAERGDIIVRRIVNPAPIRSLDVVRLADRTPTLLMQRVQTLVTELIHEQTVDGRWPVAD